MTSGTEYAKLYNEAYVAYGQGNYEKAATLIEPMAQAFPEDPDVLLLQGHIYFSLGNYQIASQQYQSVIQRSDRQDLLDCANQGLAQAQSLLTPSDSPIQDSMTPTQTLDEDESESWADEFDLDGLDWDNTVFAEADFGEPTIGQGFSTGNPFQGNSVDEAEETTFKKEIDPFATLSEDPLAKTTTTPEFEEAAIANFSLADEADLKTNDDENTFVVSSHSDNRLFSDRNGKPSSDPEGFSSSTGMEQSEFGEANASFEDDAMTQAISMDSSRQVPELNQEFNEFEAFPEESLKDLSDFDFTGINDQLPDSNLFTQGSGDLSSNLGLATEDLLKSEPGNGTAVSWIKPDEGDHTSIASNSGSLIKPDLNGKKGYVSWFVNTSIQLKPWIAAGATGVVSFVTILAIAGLTGLMGPKLQDPQSSSNQSEQVARSESDNPKPDPSQTPQESSETQRDTAPKSISPVLLTALMGGMAGFGSTLFFGLLSANYLKRIIDDFQTQFDAMYAGDYNVQATAIAQDEFGQLSTSFNQLSRVILTTTSEAQQRAAETEKAREDLQRQVIRLLDDVEGAARGDLTVEAEVTADVLGAVADAFNLTITNLREIVAQVKQTAKQVNQSSTDSELFARNNSSDALRMAEELAVTLNSVQVMTESIQRVAENAREAEEVAHTSSVTALKGGEAVERTVAGILQIRETVSETTRKVKRLAEASQEISKIVALISQIASRTNLLALNASIQAARAGEAGRGFAIVADEVRQLADRSAKSLKEIEQIVMQIQSETGSVMTAMEEGIQQVIDVTDKSEQAKRSLEDIIEVSNHINTLVRSITGDTIQQQDNSKAVAQVMQSVELTAQETSQESQRVAGSLQNLVGISRDLLASVERFRIEPAQK